MPPPAIAPLLERVSAALRADGGHSSRLDELIADHGLWEVIGRWPPDAGSLAGDARVSDAADRLEDAMRRLPSADPNARELADVVDRFRFALADGAQWAPPPPEPEGSALDQGWGGGGGDPPHPPGLDSDVVGHWPPE